MLLHLMLLLMQVKDGEVNHERHDEEHVDGKAGPCEAVAMDVNAVVRIKV